jgi:hypothetical protein
MIYFGRIILFVVLIIALSACGATKETPAQPTAQPTNQSTAHTNTIPAGPADWLVFDREFPLDLINAQQWIVPYGVASSGKKLKRDDRFSDKQSVVRYQVVCQVLALTKDDRLDVRIHEFQAVHLDNSITSYPASGYVIDNSDGRPGLRCEPSIAVRDQMVIPARATATVYFEQPITLPAR